MTWKLAKSRGWSAAAAAAILATIAALAFLGIARAAGVSNLTLSSATVAPGESVTIELTATADGVVSYNFDFAYDPAQLEATDCTSGFGICTLDNVSQIHMSGAKLAAGAGINGDVTLGTITFKAVGAEATAVNVTSNAFTQRVTDFLGDEFSGTTIPAGVITITAPTAPVDALTADPIAVPATGGAPGTSSANSMAWLLAAAGLTIVAGGAWVLARAGREN